MDISNCFWRKSKKAIGLRLKYKRWSYFFNCLAALWVNGGAWLQIHWWLFRKRLLFYVVYYENSSYHWFKLLYGCLGDLFQHKLWAFNMIYGVMACVKNGVLKSRDWSLRLLRYWMSFWRAVIWLYDALRCGTLWKWLMSLGIALIRLCSVLRTFIWFFSSTLGKCCNLFMPTCIYFSFG